MEFRPVRLLAATVVWAGIATHAPAQAQQVFINEFHYDNAGTDTGEFIEVAGPAGTDLTGWQIVRYNGSNPAAAVQYTTPAALNALAGTIPGNCGPYGVVTVSYAQDGLQNGPNDGFALVDSLGTIVQLLSYEGIFTAANGPAAGQTSTNLPVSQTSTTLVGSSLQLQGSGAVAADFSWVTTSGTNTAGTCNTGQVFLGTDTPPTVASVNPANGAAGVPVDTAVTVTFSEPVNAGPSAFGLSCSVSGAVSLSGSSSPNSTFILNPVSPLQGGETCTLGITAAEVTDVDGSPDQLQADFAASFSTIDPLGSCGSPATLVSAVQGAGGTSPQTGQVAVIEAVVSGDFQATTREGQPDPGLSGFFLQEESLDQDASPATSEGIFVFQGNASVTVPDVQPGDLVRLRGTVTEFSSSGITLTEITSISGIAVCSAGGYAVAPTPVTLPVPAVSDWERYEGMLVSIAQPMTVTGNFNLGAFDEIDVALGRLANPTNVALPGAAAQSLQDQNNRSRIILDDGSNLSRAAFDPPARIYPDDDPATPLIADPGLSAENTLRAGDGVSGAAGAPIVGVLDQRFGAYRLHPTVDVRFTRANPRAGAPSAVGGNLRVGSFNVLNYFTTLDGSGPVCGPTGGLDCRGADSSQEFIRQRDKVISAIAAMDAHVVGLIEIENNSTASLADLVAGLNLATSPGKYSFVNTGTIGTDAIKVGFIFQPAAVTALGTPATLTSAVDPRALDSLNRPALAQTFRFNNQRPSLSKFTVVVNHFKSKGSACAGDPDTGDGQGNCNRTRVSMANALRDWLVSDPTGSSDPDFLIIGDLNAYLREDPVRALTEPAFGLPGFPPSPAATYTALVPPAGYSYQFQGQFGYLDHALASASLRQQVTGTTIWHVNADEPLSMDYNTEWTTSIAKNANQLDVLYDDGPFTSSDHDPVLVGLNLLCGDLDDDGDVDAADQARFRSYPNSTNSRADYDGDGTVTLRDYQKWAQCYRTYTTTPR